MAANSVNFTKPLSTSELSAQAGDFEYDTEVPLRYWLRTADAIHKQAQFYDRDGDDQHAYLLYMRYALLFLEKLPSHPEAKQANNRKLIKAANEIVSADLKRLEVLKPGLNRKAKRYQEALAKRKEATEQAATARETSIDLARDVDGLSLGYKTGNLHEEKKTLEASEHKDLAAKLARREKRRRKVHFEEPVPRSSPESRRPSRQDHRDEVQRDLMEAHKRVPPSIPGRNASLKNATKTPTTNLASYPSVPGRSAASTGDSIRASPTLPNVAPQRPPKNSISERPAISPSLPPKQHPAFEPPPATPPKLALYDPSSSPPTRSSTSTPDINPRDFTFKPAAYLESGTPLRTIFISPNLRSTFLSLASRNTSMNQEFLGILSGTLISNAFFITRLVVPPQTATSDTCEMTEDGEIALWQYCDTNDLLTLGWIHTHPTQTCFMSSRDLHTHSGYQAQMAESVAIVCAPRHEPTWGAFRLTDPPGLGHVLGCKQTGIFHPHSETNLYTDAMRPGHVCELPALEFEVVDLR